MEIELNCYYKHFKGNIYKVLNIAKHTETGELLVIYQGVSNEQQIFARPYKMFSSKVDKTKYPNSNQTYRFEKINNFSNPNNVWGVKWLILF